MDRGYNSSTERDAMQSAYEDAQSRRLESLEEKEEKFDELEEQNEKLKEALKFKDGIIRGLLDDNSILRKDLAERPTFASRKCNVCGSEYIEF